LKHLVHIALSLGITYGVLGQTSLSFYHLGNATFQNSFQNPSFIPEGTIFVGLPGMSGVHVHANNKFSYSDFIVSGESGNQIDSRLLLSNLQKSNMVHAAVDVNLLHLAYTTNSGVNFSLFANERVEASVLYPKNLISFAAEGNLALAGERLDISKTKASVNHFREYGIGFAIPVNTVTFGLRAKYLQGFFNASTAQDFTAFLTTNPEDYSLNLELTNGTLQTSGYNILQGNTGNLGNHLISNPNRGAALDLGLTTQVNDFNTFSASITDLGFITWEEDITNYTLGDTTFNYSGVSLKSPGDLEQIIRDTLFTKFEDKLTESTSPYSNALSPKALLSWSYKTPIGGDVVGTYGAQYIQGQIKHLMGLGYRHPIGKFFIGSASITRLPQQFINLGAAVTVKGGPAQFYLAVDQVVNYDATKFQAIDVRVGINFIFGSNSKEEQTSSAFANNEPSTKQAKGGKVASWSFLGSKVKARGKDGIYTIIEKQERRDPKEYKSDPDEKEE
jgi:hypothetical protein